MTQQNKKPSFAQFTRNIAEDETSVVFTEDELEGVDYTQFKCGTEPHTRIVTLKAPDVTPVLQFAKRARTRQRMATAKASQCQAQVCTCISTPTFSKTSPN